MPMRGALCIARKLRDMSGSPESLAGVDEAARAHAATSLSALASYPTFTEFEPIILEVRDGDGRTGWGEGHISPAPAARRAKATLSTAKPIAYPLTGGFPSPSI